MAKFILVRDFGEFDKIKDYIKKHRGISYYLAPKLMYDYLNSLRYRCVVGLIMDDIKIQKHDKIDLLTMPVYNKVFQTNVFRIDGIKDYFLKRMSHELDYDSVVFGIEDDISSFMQFDIEEI